jgi:hypothetical protein
MAEPSNVQQGTWCSRCYGNKKLDIKKMQEMAAEKNGKCLSSVYINKETKLQWQCAERHVWKATPGQIRQGHWCNICARKKAGMNARGHTIAEMQRLAKARGGYCLSKEYINQYFHLAWQCKKGHKWQAVPKTIIAGSWCPVCYKEKPRCKYRRARKTN